MAHLKFTQRIQQFAAREPNRDTVNPSYAGHRPLSVQGASSFTGRVREQQHSPRILGRDGSGVERIIAPAKDVRQIGRFRLKPPGKRTLSHLDRYVDMIRRSEDTEHAHHEPLSVNDIVFLDTETTGLGRGPETYAFLVGLAYVDSSGKIMCEQHFLKRPAAEPELLEMLSPHLARTKLIVTFNGKCFDLPLLKSRFQRYRMRMPEAYVHLDLIHHCRRVFGPYLPNCRLTTLETDLLQFSRVEDIPGAMAPMIYSDYLATKTMSENLRLIIEHIAKTYFPMLPILSEAMAHLISPLRHAWGTDALIRIGRWHTRCGDRKLGQQCLRAAKA